MLPFCFLSAALPANKLVIKLQINGGGASVASRERMRPLVTPELKSL